VSTHPLKIRSASEKESARRRPVRSREVAPTMSRPDALQRAVADPASARPMTVLMLQRHYGNRAVQRLLASGSVQAKLTVGPAGDQYEKEADHVADQVMKMPAPSSAARGQPSVQRQGEEDAPAVQASPLSNSITPLLQRQAEEEDAPAVQTKRQDPRAGFEAGSAIENQLQNQQGSGSPLPGETRSFMEERFAADFSGVRVHTGGEASQLNRQLSAQAFTHGQDIYLSDGKYNPSSSEGKRLLAHELTHTIQQTGGVHRKAAVAVSTAPAGKIQRELWTRNQLTAKGGEVGAKAKVAKFFGKASTYNKILNLLDQYAQASKDQKLALLSKLQDLVSAWLKEHGNSTDESEQRRAEALHELEGQIAREQMELSRGTTQEPWALGNLKETLDKALAREKIKTDTQGIVFRSDTELTRLMAAYAQAGGGSSFVMEALGPVMSEVLKTPNIAAKTTPTPEDPLGMKKAIESDDIKTVTRLFKLIMESILRTRVVPLLAKECAAVADAVWAKTGNGLAAYNALVNIIALRLLNPGFVDPVKAKVITQYPKGVSGNAKTLVLLSGMMQKMANRGTTFNAEEMNVFSPALAEYKDKFVAYLLAIYEQGEGQKSTQIRSALGLR